MATMIQSLPSTQVSGFGFAGHLARRISTALAARRARLADQDAVRDMDPRLLADIGALRHAAGPTGLAMMSPGVVACSLFPSARGR